MKSERRVGVRRVIRPLITGFLTALAAGAIGMVGGCAQIPECTVSPIEIEETREDVKVLEKDLVEARGRAKKLSDELASKQAELESKKDKPKELRKKLKELKKGSGRDDDKDKEDDEETT
jgi:septal ring factor EnvC (AmiA/AmiB activator)